MHQADLSVNAGKVVRPRESNKINIKITTAIYRCEAPPTAPTPAAQAIARRTNSRAFGLDPSRMNGGSLVEVAAAIGSAHKAKNAKTVIQILYAAIMCNGCVLFTKPDMHAYIDRTHTTMKETGREY